MARNAQVAEPLRSIVNGVGIDYSTLPRGRETMRMYIEHRIDPGTGTRLILAHDLAAIVYCDDETVRAMPGIYRWVYNHAPAACHGSAEKVQRWLNRTEEK